MSIVAYFCEIVYIRFKIDENWKPELLLRIFMRKNETQNTLNFPPFKNNESSALCVAQNFSFLKPNPSEVSIFRLFNDIYIQS
jgi:hypothetical protein